MSKDSKNEIVHTWNAMDHDYGRAMRLAVACGIDDELVFFLEELRDHDAMGGEMWATLTTASIDSLSADQRVLYTLGEMILRTMR